MFDIAFSELIIIGIVALMVIGPERLPRVARTIGALLGRAQRYVGDVKADINREIQLDELKKMQAQMADSFRSVEDSVRSEVDAARTTVEQPLQATVAEVSQAAPTVETSVPTVATLGLAEQIEASESEAPTSAPAPEPTKETKNAA